MRRAIDLEMHAFNKAEFQSGWQTLGIVKARTHEFLRIRAFRCLTKQLLYLDCIQLQTLQASEESNILCFLVHQKDHASFLVIFDGFLGLVGDFDGIYLLKALLCLRMVGALLHNNFSETELFKI